MKAKILHFMDVYICWVIHYFVEVSQNDFNLRFEAK